MHLANNRKSLLQAIATVFFPPICLECEEALDEVGALLCAQCTTLLTPLDATYRCDRCFSETCKCTLLSCGIKRSCFVFPHMGPAKRLVMELKKTGDAKLARSIASWMLVQIDKVGIPWPDLIVAPPRSFVKTLLQEPDREYLLVETLGKLMGVPTKKLHHHPFQRIQRERSVSSLLLLSCEGQPKEWLEQATWCMHKAKISYQALYLCTFTDPDLSHF